MLFLTHTGNRIAVYAACKGHLYVTGYAKNH